MMPRTSDAEEDALFLDNVYWREPLPLVDFDDAGAASAPAPAAGLEPLNVASTVVAGSSRAAASLDRPAASRTVIEVHHVHHHVHVMPQTPDPAASLPSPRAESPVRLVALDDAWVTREVYDREMRLRAERDASEQQRKVEMLLGAVERERRERERVEGELALEKNRASKELANLDAKVTSVLRGVQGAALFTSVANPVSRNVEIGPLATVSPQSVTSSVAVLPVAAVVTAPMQKTSLAADFKSSVNTNPWASESKQISAPTNDSTRPFVAPTARSDATLASVDDILGDSSISKAKLLDKDVSDKRKSVGIETRIAQIIGSDSAFVRGEEAASVDNNVAKEASPFGMTVARLFRYFNLVRAIVTAIYSVVSATNGLYNQYYIALEAQGLMIALIIFSLVDLIVAVIKAFPKLLWRFWSVRDWDPFTKVYSIWAVIADHELLTDMAPLMINLSLKLYSYRLTEIVANPDARDSILSTQIGLDQISDPQHHNFVLLMLFGVTLLFTILFHAARLFKVLAFDKKAPILAGLVVVKALLLVWDITTNNLLLYETLVFKGTQIFRSDRMIRIALSLVIPCAVVTLTTNVLINLPLHYFFLRMQLAAVLAESSKVHRDSKQSIKKGAEDDEHERGEQDLAARKAAVDAVGYKRVLNSALRKSFHPLVSAIFGTYAVYSIIASALLLYDLNVLDPNSIGVGFVKTFGINQGNSTSLSGAPSWLFSNTTTSVVPPSDRRTAFSTMVLINLAANYVVGAVAAVCYWIFIVLGPGVLGGVRGAKWLARRVFRGRTAAGASAGNVDRDGLTAGINGGSA